MTVTREINVNEYSPLTLAFLGDAVFELLVREELLLQGNMPVKALHQKAVQQVCARAQYQASRNLLERLSEEEMNVFKRGRNAATGHQPKSANGKEYHGATGFEAVFGYLQLKGEQERIRELFTWLRDRLEENHENER